MIKHECIIWQNVTVTARRSKSQVSDKRSLGLESLEIFVIVAITGELIGSKERDGQAPIIASVGNHANASTVSWPLMHRSVDL